MIIKPFALALGALMAFSSAMASASEVTIDDQTDLGLTIYNQDLALVRDSRRLNTQAGIHVLSIADVSARIMPETALLEGGEFTVLEQNFDYDLLTPAKLLEKAIGQTVRLYRQNPATGEETEEVATVLSTNAGVVLQIGDRIEVMNGSLNSLPGRLVFERIPANLRARPTLSMLINSPGTRDQVTLNYLTGGIGWKADYVAQLNEDETAINLRGWVTLNNQSGTPYRNARVQLVAGEVNRVEPEPRRPTTMMMREMAAADQQVRQEALFEYHLYTLPRKTSVENNQTKQVSFLQAPMVRVKKVLESKGLAYLYTNPYRDLEPAHATVYVSFENSAKAGLGQPLPAGIIRAYKKDSAGSSHFVGEDRINHTPKNEDVRLNLGEAFDVTVHRKQTAFRKDARAEGGVKFTDYHSSYEIIVKNAKEAPVEVRVVETLPGDWRITSESAPHKKEDAFSAVWTLAVPAEGQKKFSYSVLTRNP